jgi:hypothetical protein
MDGQRAAIDVLSGRGAVSHVAVEQWATPSPEMLAPCRCAGSRRRAVDGPELPVEPGRDRPVGVEWSGPDEAPVAAGRTRMACPDAVGSSTDLGGDRQ